MVDEQVYETFMVGRVLNMVVLTYFNTKVNVAKGEAPEWRIYSAEWKAPGLALSHRGNYVKFRERPLTDEEAAAIQTKKIAYNPYNIPNAVTGSLVPETPVTLPVPAAKKHNKRKQAPAPVPAPVPAPAPAPAPVTAPAPAMAANLDVQSMATAIAMALATVLKK